ncbi:MAG: PQQ-binding-like beta-propeller repeat protein, partial [Chitinivibrionales bacterium]|nr:PQQ-binding-like beta-propeller repeat protein [Chitinivibrionales bacterium]
ECALSRSCLVLDPHDGTTLAELILPDSAAWGMLAVSDSFLITTADPIAFDSTTEDCYVYSYKNKSLVGPGGLKTLNYAASPRLYVLNRYSGDIRWHADARTSFFHRAIAAGDGRLFAIDRFPAAGADTSAPSAVKAWDLRTGKLLWADSTRVFARYLAYSPTYDLLVQASRKSRDYFQGEPRPNRMVAWQAADGAVLWEIAPELDDAASILGELFYYGGPIMLNDRTIITQDGNDFMAVDLLTGAVHTVSHPLTEEKVDFYFRRHYGCTYAKGCPSLIAFRSGNAGMFDLENMSGVHTFGGFKSGCTPSLIPGGGLLNAPEYTRTCGCSYPLQTSCALVYSPSTEVWTTNEGLAKRTGAAVLTRVGLNFGAPGDRMDAHGTLWLDYPAGAVAAGFGNQELPLRVTVEGDSVRTYRHHSLRFTGVSPWIGCSGLEGVRRISIDLTLDSLTDDSTRIATPAPEREVDLTLYFAEPALGTTGTRIFAVAVGDSTVVAAYDPYAAAGAIRKTVAMRIGPIAVRDSVEIALTPVKGETVISGIGVVPHGSGVIADAQAPVRGYVDLSAKVTR